MSEKIEFKTIDPEGMKTLNVVAGAEHFNKWMYQTINPYCFGRILEIGSGIGNISKFFINDNQEMSLSDIRHNYIDILKNRFEKRSNLNEVFKMDIVAPDFDIKFADYFNRFNSIYTLNVIEHVNDDNLGIANCRKLLKPGGSLIVLVPAYQKLYNSFDKELGHYRRYTLGQLDQLMIKNGFNILHHQYFNCVGILGWWLNGGVLKKKTIPEGQMGLYNSLVPLFKLIDKCIFNTFGLSVISVGQKNK